jgi:hypothetical protein
MLCAGNNIELDLDTSSASARGDPTAVIDEDLVTTEMYVQRSNRCAANRGGVVEVGRPPRRQQIPPQLPGIHRPRFR